MLKNVHETENVVYLNRNVRKCIFGYERPAKIQISLRICTSDQNLHLAQFE